MNPINVRLPFKVKAPILALGSQTKNTVCFAKGDSADIGPVHADLAAPAGLLAFEREAGRCLKKRPKIIAYDLHPEYASTKFAAALGEAGRRLFGVQHHHAHIASCMAENGLGNKKVIGVAFDGTGLGSDGTLWGAEFLVCDYKGFKRAGHLKEVPLLGGERAVLEPWRLAAAWLNDIYKDGFLKLDLEFVKGLDKGKWLALRSIYLKGFGFVAASSMGRLFDAAGAVILGKHRSGFEAELAMELEKACVERKGGSGAYDFAIMERGGAYVIDPSGVFKGIVRDLKKGHAKGDVAYSFHLSAAEMAVRMCLLLRRRHRIGRVALSGGVFQNKILTALVCGGLQKEGFEVFTHRFLSCNDSGVSLGQAAAANF